MSQQTFIVFFSIAKGKLAKFRKIFYFSKPIWNTIYTKRSIIFGAARNYQGGNNENNLLVKVSLDEFHF